MDQTTLALIATIPLIIILLIERKGWRKYVALGLFTMLLALIFESIWVFLGAWQYSIEPQILGVGVHTIIGYFHYIVFVYFTGNAIVRRSKHV